MQDQTRFHTERVSSHFPSGPRCLNLTPIKADYDQHLSNKVLLKDEAEDFNEAISKLLVANLDARKEERAAVKALREAEKQEKKEKLVAAAEARKERKKKEQEAKQAKKEERERKKKEKEENKKKNM